MKTIDDLLKEPETFKEKLKDFWYDVSYYYPRRLRDGWWAIKRFCRNLRKFWGILWKDDDFDQGYLEDIILKKLIWMSDYFRTARIVVREERIYNQINLAIRVGKIAFEKDTEDELYGSGEYGFYYYLGYVNLRNYKRFWASIKPDQLNDEEIKGMHWTELRRLKARHIFYKILSQYSSTWWD